MIVGNSIGTGIIAELSYNNGGVKLVYYLIAGIVVFMRTRWIGVWST